jgi:AraC-like DNA-binding protein
VGSKPYSGLDDGPLVSPMTNWRFESMEERPSLPAEADFIQNWAVLAQKSGYRRHRLARLVQVSTRTLDRYFRKHLSLSVRQWLTESQLVDAYHQVMTGKPLKEISFDVGFKQPSHFTKRFKARFGIPPSLLLGSRAFVSARSLSRSCASSPAGDPEKNHNDHAACSHAE